MRKLFPFVQFVAGMLAGTVGLFWFADAVQHRASKSAGRIERTTFIKSAVHTILAPQDLIDFAKRHPSIEDHEELVLLLKAEGIKGYWYAVVAMDLLSTGEVYRNASYVLPGSMEHKFPSTKAILERLSGTPGSYDTHIYEKAKIVVLARENARKHPGALIEDLIETLH